MRKKLIVAVIIMTMLLCLPTTCYASTGTTVSTKDDVINENIINLETLEDNQTVIMEMGKEYILSCPIDEDEDWQLDEIRLKVKDSTDDWISLRGKGEDEDEKSDYLDIKDVKIDQHRMLIKIVCKAEIVSLSVIIRNEKTKDTTEYTLDDVKVVKNTSNGKMLLVVRPKPSSSVSAKSELAVPKKTEETEESEVPKEPEVELIIIDTSEWRYEVVKGVYNGTEYVAIVTGLPDYVTAVYVNNTRTNAGEQTAYVTFEVPEGYAIPEGMETTISISKADIDAIEIDKNWMLTNLENGTITITPPSSSVQKGVICQYTVNGEEVGNSYTIDDTGIYSVEVNFSLTEEMKQNYNLTNESSKAVFQVNPEIFSRPAYNLHFGELEAPEGQKKVEIWFEYTDDTFSTNSVQWHIQYDNDILELVSSTKGPNMTLGSQRPYEEGDSSSGYGHVLGTCSTWATFLELTFNVLDPEATDIVINLTDIIAAGGASTNYQQAGTNGTGIVLNQTSNLIGVTLPTAPTAKTMQVSKEDVDLVDSATETSSKDANLVESTTEVSSKDVDLVESATETSSKDVDLVESSTETSSKEVDLVESSTETSSKEVDLVESATETSSEDANLVDSNTEEF